MNIASLKPSESDPTHPRLTSTNGGRTRTQDPRYENGISPCVNVYPSALAFLLTYETASVGKSICLVNKERREDTRLELRLEGQGTVYSEGKDSQIEVIAQNISAWGAYCVTDASVSVGDKVKLLLQWDPNDKQSEIVFKAVGRIVRVDQQPEEGYGFGVQFDEIPVLDEIHPP